MQLRFVDNNPAVAAALRESFAGHPEIEVICGDLLEHARDCVVSPANSYGYMDGGIDAAYSRFFGPQLQGLFRGPFIAVPKGCCRWARHLRFRPGMLAYRG
jgi:hypothetical protein